MTSEVTLFGVSGLFLYGKVPVRSPSVSVSFVRILRTLFRMIVDYSRLSFIYSLNKTFTRVCKDIES